MLGTDLCACKRPTFVSLCACNKLVTKATKVSKHSKASIEFVVCVGVHECMTYVASYFPNLQRCSIIPNPCALRKTLILVASPVPIQRLVSIKKSFEDDGDK